MPEIIPVASLTDNYIWILSGDADDSENRDVWVVDPGDHRPVEQWLAETERQLAGILVTHHHWDHVDGIAPLKSQQTPVLGPGGERFKGTTQILSAGDLVELPWCNLQVMEVPGHTLNHLAYFAAEGFSTPVLFCGDTLFSAGCGRLFEGTPEQMYHSLQQINQLPGDTQIYCTHEYTLANLKFALAVEPGNTAAAEHLKRCQKLREEGKPTLPTSLAQERQINPFLRSSEPTLINSCEEKFQTKIDSPAQCFALTRQWKDEF